MAEQPEHLGDLSSRAAEFADVARGAAAVLRELDYPDTRLELVAVALRAASESASKVANDLSRIATDASGDHAGTGCGANKGQTAA
jgi:hypothetical protein